MPYCPPGAERVNSKKHKAKNRKKILKQQQMYTMKKDKFMRVTSKRRAVN